MRFMKSKEHVHRYHIYHMKGMKSVNIKYKISLIESKQLENET